MEAVPCSAAAAGPGSDDAPAATAAASGLVPVQLLLHEPAGLALMKLIAEHSGPTCTRLPPPLAPPALLLRLWTSPAPQLTDIILGLVPSMVADGPPPEQPGMLLVLGLLPSRGEGVMWVVC